MTSSPAARPSCRTRSPDRPSLCLPRPPAPRRAPDRREAPLGIVDALGARTRSTCARRVVCDWIQYRPQLAPGRRCAGDPRSQRRGGEVEVAVDLRLADVPDLSAHARAAFAHHHDGGDGARWSSKHGPISPRAASGASTASTGRRSVSGSRRRADVRAGVARRRQRRPQHLRRPRLIADDQFGSWDRLAARQRAARRAVRPGARRRQRQPGQHVPRRVRAAGPRTGRDYYRRLHYLMGDYSPHVLEAGRAEAVAHARCARQRLWSSTPPGRRRRSGSSGTRPS